MILRFLFHLVFFAVLTILTQIGGIVYLISIITVDRKINYSNAKRTALFLALYSISTFVIVPIVAPLFGREKIMESEMIVANSFIYKLANRNYVKPKLNQAIQKISDGLNRKNKGIKLVYLDANFPFIDGFPLLPHLSHNDGKKLDISFVYEDKDKKLTNLKPSVSGYGVFEEPRKTEYDQISVCKSKGYWQYDYAQYLTFGQINSEINFSSRGTKDLMNSIINQPNVRKIFIEPHLKSRMNLKHDKIRFHGCKAVRHDDHIHFQL